MEDTLVGDILHLKMELLASMQMALGVCWGSGVDNFSQTLLLGFQV